jgi:hypothetical protein
VSTVDPKQALVAQAGSSPAASREFVGISSVLFLERVLLRHLKFPSFPARDFKNSGALRLDDDRLNAEVYCVGFSHEMRPAVRPLLSALRTQVRHRAMSEKRQTQTSRHPTAQSAAATENS